ncbi:hypothetical protein D3C75_1093010 [compost metagenome]
MGLYPISPRIKGEPVSQAKKPAEQAAKTITLPLKTGDFKICIKPRLGFLSAEGTSLLRSFSSKVGISSRAVIPSSTAKMARHPIWLSNQAPSSGASAGERATSGIMEAKTRLALPSR